MAMVMVYVLLTQVDFTKSNQWTGERSFGGRCLHDIDPKGMFMNPYQVRFCFIRQIWGYKLEFNTCARSNL